MGDALGEDRSKALAFARSRHGEPFDADLGGGEDGVLGLRFGRAATPLQRLVNRERTRVRQVIANGAVDARQVGELLRRRLGDDAFGAARAGAGAARSCRA